MGLLRYRAVTRRRFRRLGPALAGLASGAVLAGVAVVAMPSSAPASVVLGSLDGVPGAATIVTPSSTTSTTSSATPTGSAAPARSTAGPAASAAPRTSTPTTARSTPRPVASGPAVAVVARTNAERAAAGCGALRVDSRLTSAAQGHASDMAANEYFSHTGQDGRDFAAREKAAGYPRPGGENIAQGQPDAASVIDAWMNSSGHRANILNCSFTTIGVGFDARGDYWVQDFGF